MKISIRTEPDAAHAASAARRAAAELGFDPHAQTLIATAASELAINITRYARFGWMELHPIERGRRRGLEVVFRDAGDGIDDIALAMTDGHTTRDSLGMGLPAVKRMMDEFTLTSEPGRGTRAVIRKFLPAGSESGRRTGIGRAP